MSVPEKGETAAQLSACAKEKQLAIVLFPQLSSSSTK